MKNINNPEYKNILVITSQAAGTGDILMAVPVFRALREYFPTARLTLVVNPVTVEIMAGNPYFNDILIYNRQACLAGKLSFIRQIREKRFDLALCLSECFSTLLLCYLSGATVKVGFNWEGRGLFLTYKIPYNKPENKYLTELFLDLVRAIGLPEETLNAQLGFWLKEKDKEAIKSFFRNKEIVEQTLKIVIHPGAGWSPRRWPAENFARLAKELMERYQAAVFVTGSRQDRALIERIIRLAGMGDGSGEEEGERLFNCAGCFIFSEYAALLSLSHLFIGNDSAPMHLAAAVAIPVIALFGPSSVVKYGPRTEQSAIIKSPAQCGPCRQLTGQDRCIQGQPECMRRITVEDVIQAVEKTLNVTPDLTGER